MAVEVRCPCGERFQVEDDQRGSAAACPECGKEVATPPRRPAGRKAEPFPVKEVVLALCVQAERVWKAVWAKAAPLAAAAWEEVRQTASYYREHRHALVQRVQEFVSRLPDYEREIRVTVDDSRTNATLEDDHWTVQLPDCCITCGAATPRDWETDSRQVADVTAAFWAPVVGLAAGFVLSLLLGSVWWLFVALLLSFVPGYRLRREVTVDLELRRCQAHAEHANVPKVFAFGEQLVIRCGDRAVKQQQLRQRRDGTTPMPNLSEEPREEVAPIPLDDCETPSAIQTPAPLGEDEPTLPLEDDDLIVVSTPVSYSGQDAADSLEFDELSRASQADAEEQPALHNPDVLEDYVAAAFSSETAPEDRVEAEEVRLEEIDLSGEKEEYGLSDEPPVEPTPEDKG